MVAAYKVFVGVGPKRHSYSGCNQHGADEHGLKSLFREGLGAVAALYWDFGEGGTPKDA